MEEEGVLPDIPEPRGRRYLFQADDTLHFFVDDPHGEVERDDAGRYMLCVEAAGKPAGGLVQACRNPEHLTGLLSFRHPVDRGRDFLPEDDHGPGGREELPHRCPVRVGEILDADPGADVDSFVRKERLDIHSGTSWSAWARTPYQGIGEAFPPRIVIKTLEKKGSGLDRVKTTGQLPKNTSRSGHRSLRGDHPGNPRCSAPRNDLRVLEPSS